jgi:MinD superfamily P-loop ATPase
MKNGERNKDAGTALPRVSAEKCNACGECAKVCFRKAISFDENDKAMIFRRRCVGADACGRCLNACGNEAITAD